MKKLAISMLTITLILIPVMSFALISSLSSKGNYAKIQEYTGEYTNSHTKAICNSENLCQDYEIFCKYQKVIKMSPITGAVVQFPSDWKDPRDKETIEKLC